MAKYTTVKRGGRNRAVCEGCKARVNRLQAYRTPTLAKACRDCATSEELYGPPFVIVGGMPLHRAETCTDRAHTVCRKVPA